MNIQTQILPDLPIAPTGASIAPAAGEGDVQPIDMSFDAVLDVDMDLHIEPEETKDFLENMLIPAYAENTPPIVAEQKVDQELPIIETMEVLVAETESLDKNEMAKEMPVIETKIDTSETKSKEIIEKETPEVELETAPQPIKTETVKAPVEMADRKNLPQIEETSTEIKQVLQTTQKDPIIMKKSPLPQTNYPVTGNPNRPFVQSEISLEFSHQIETITETADILPMSMIESEIILPNFTMAPTTSTPLSQIVQKMSPAELDISIKQPVLEALQTHLAQPLQKMPEGETHMKIQLHPEDLGSVTLQVDISKEGQSKVFFTADNAIIKDMLRQYSGEIIQIFEQSNLSLDFSGLGFSSRQDQEQDQNTTAQTPYQQGNIAENPIEATGSTNIFLRPSGHTGIDIHV